MIDANSESVDSVEVAEFMVRLADIGIVVTDFKKAAKLWAWHHQQLEEAERRGASIAAEQINREFGLELTLDGRYYLLRHSRKGHS